MHSGTLPRGRVAAHSRSNRKIHLESLCTRVKARQQHPGGSQRRAEMWDAIMLVAVIVAFFALAITYSRIDRL
jgi:hypothetical protein